MIYGTKGKKRVGATLIESCVVLFVTLLLVVAMLDLGVGVMRYNQVSDAARQAARQIIVHGAVSSDPWGAETIGPVKADVNLAFVKTIRSRLPEVDPQSVAVKAEWMDDDNEPGSRIKVVVRTNYRPILGILIGNQCISLRGTSVMRIQH